MQITADDNISISGGGDSKTDINASGHGHLVQQILETQKELANEDSPKVEIVSYIFKFELHATVAGVYYKILIIC